MCRLQVQNKVNNQWGVFSMPNFEQYVARHGEFGVQAIIERLERYEGIHSRIGTPLEERWASLMQADAPQQRLAA
jgi:hypothetical protein